MPIPPPEKGEDKQTYISRCASIMADRDPDKPNEQRVAMCYSKWDQVKEEKMHTHKKAIDLAESKKFNDFKKRVVSLLASKASTALESKKSEVAESIVTGAKSSNDRLDESKAYDNGSMFSIELTPGDVSEWNSRWGSGGVPERNIWFQFDKSTGDLVDMDPRDLDGEAVQALSQDAQYIAAKKLGLGRSAMPVNYDEDSASLLESAKITENRSGPADEGAAKELELYIENDRELYERQFVPIIRNLKRKKARGKYDSEKAVDLFMYLVHAGAKKYMREHAGRNERLQDVFNKNTRLVVARSLRDTFENEDELGNYDTDAFK